MRPDQTLLHCLIHRHRWQASSHRVQWCTQIHSRLRSTVGVSLLAAYMSAANPATTNAPTYNPATPRTLVGAGLPAMRPDQTLLHCQTHRHRWQASSHRVQWCTQIHSRLRSTVGVSLLAAYMSAANPATTNAPTDNPATPRTLVGAGLPAMRPDQTLLHCQTHRYRWQASSHRVQWCTQIHSRLRSTVGVSLLAAYMSAANPATTNAPTDNPATPRTLVGAGLPAMRPDQTLLHCLIHRHRWQASSHRVQWCTQIHSRLRSTVGVSLLAAYMSAANPATTNAPTDNPATPRTLVGAGLPAMRPDKTLLHCLIHRHRWQASSHRVQWCTQIHSRLRSTVGVSLLAAYMSAANPATTNAPTDNPATPRTLVGAGLPAMRPDQTLLHCQTHRHRWQASSHRVQWCTQIHSRLRSTVGVSLLAAYMSAANPATTNAPTDNPATPRTLVGAGLPAMRPDQTLLHCLIHRHRWQASSHRVQWCTQIHSRLRSTVGVSLLAIAVSQAQHKCLNNRYREQARSYSLICVGFRGRRCFGSGVRAGIRSAPAPVVKPDDAADRPPIASAAPDVNHPVPAPAGHPSTPRQQ
jgi:hypothetical protein